MAPRRRSEEIALSSLIFRIHADDPTSSHSQTQKGRKERNKWKTPIGFCGVFVQQIQHRFSHRLQSRAVGGEGERDRSARPDPHRAVQIAS